MVTNSMAITCRANDVNRLNPATSGYVASDVTLGLLIDVMSDTLQYQRVATPVTGASDISMVAIPDVGAAVRSHGKNERN